MSENELYIIQHILITLEIDTQGQKLLLARGISSTRNKINNKDETYQSLVGK